MRSSVVYGSLTPEHASLTLDGYRLPGPCITRLLSNHFRLKERQDGVGNVKRSSRLGHIIARLVKGDERSHLLQMMPNPDGSLQMYTKDGSPLPVDHQLCLSSYLSSFPPLSILCDSINDIP